MRHSRQVGNFPQAFSHLTLILAARAITTAEEAGRRALLQPPVHRRDGEPRRGRGEHRARDVVSKPFEPTRSAANSIAVRTKRP